jgi:hypothetical protein
MWIAFLIPETTIKRQKNLDGLTQTIIKIPVQSFVDNCLSLYI